jgi:deoxycytidylate deaminase
MLDIATVIARRSTCSRLQVGAVLTDMRMEQLWVGYNGGAKGVPNGCRRADAGNCGCLHAEVNAVIKAPGDIEKMAFLTHSPCEACATALVNAHVIEVHFNEEYRSQEGLFVLVEGGVRTYSALTTIQVADTLCR